MENTIYKETANRKYKNTVKDDNVICALSGGVDSSVAAILINKAIGKNLKCIMVDTGLLRKNEFKFTYKELKKNTI